tara:strand:+ start:469 stop:3492 length:3024 start_codon:yes stop_codon:yes gene_type:complete
MTDLVTIAQSDSTNDGSGASTVMEPPQVDNAADDAILIKVTQSLNNSGQVGSINVTTPTGYTLLIDLRDAEVRSWLYYKRSTGSETIPTVTSDTSAKWTCTTAVVTDVDWVNGGVTQQVSATGGGDQQSPNITTDSGGTASAVLCFYSLERRLPLGFRYPDTRTTTVYKGAVTTGSSEGIDNASAAGFDFIANRNASWVGPFWSATSSGDSLAINVEVLVLGNIIPLQSATYVKQAAPANSLELTMDWCRKIIASGKDLDGNTLQTWTFNASSDVTPSNNRISITGHGMDESMVLYLTDGGNTAPSGLANDTFYYAFPRDANTIRLCTVNEDADATSDYYYDGTSQRPIVDITSTGSGTMTFTEARMINAGQAALDVRSPSPGDSANVGPAAGNYIGDAGYNQNFVGTAQRFNSVFAATNEVITFDLQVNSSGRIDRVLMTLIDEDGDWMNWLIYKAGVSTRSTGQLVYQFAADKASVQASKYKEHGTFDSTRIRYLVVAGRGNNASANKFGAINSETSIVNLGGPFTAVKGSNASLTELVDLAQTYTTTITKPSDLQVVSTIPLAIGDGTSDVSFVDSEKSIAFPPLADGVNTFQNYLDSLGVTINATASSTVKLQNTQIGASVPYTFDVIAASGATIDITGNSYVFATTSLDADATYNRQLFVGGEGVKDNGAEIRNSTFIVNSQLGADKGIVDLDSHTDIESSAFELASGTTTGHAIKINAAGSYTFNALTFTGFGADGSSTAAIYNNSGGAVSIVIDGGNNPTIRNGAGATTTLNLPARNVSVTGIVAGSTIRVYNTTTSTQVVNQLVSGTSYTASYNEGVGYSIGDVLEIRVAKIDKLEFSTSVVVTDTGWGALVSQDANPVYADYGVDGSTITGISWDSGNMQFDFNDADNQIDGADIGAWYYYFITTTTGIAEAFGALSWPQINKITNITGKVAITFDNVKSTPLRINNCWIDRDDGASIIASSSNSIQIDPPAVFVVDGGENSDIADIKKNTNLIPALL